MPNLNLGHEGGGAENTATSHFYPTTALLSYSKQLTSVMTSTEAQSDERKALYGRFRVALEKLTDEATANKDIDEENPNLIALCDEIYNVLSQ